jgi:mRNA interferase RelE/StbE
VDNSSEYRFFETDEFIQKLGKFLKSDAMSLRAKLQSYAYPQLREQPFYGANIRKLRGFSVGVRRYRIGKFRVFMPSMRKLESYPLFLLRRGMTHIGSSISRRRLRLVYKKTPNRPTHFVAFIDHFSPPSHQRILLSDNCEKATREITMLPNADVSTLCNVLSIAGSFYGPARAGGGAPGLHGKV